MVYRIYTEKKKEAAGEARALLSDINTLLGIHSVNAVRIFNRYDAEGIEKSLFDYAVRTVFSEPQTDRTSEEIESDGATVFATEYLPGQFDQRADSAAQCIQLISQGERPTIRTAKVYFLYGNVSEEELAAVKKYVINPVEAREARLEKPLTLAADYDLPTSVATVEGFTSLDRKGLAEFVKNYSLAMDEDDAEFCRDYFRKENRDPTITEIRMIDTYWSDHCRHTTFLTRIDRAEFDDPLLAEEYEKYLAIRRELGRENKPVCLMDLATIAAKYLKKQGKLDKLDESEEINACTVKIKVDVDGKPEDWLLLFKNETHNHPTEIEPFGGAATCIGGAIRDPLSGRSYVYGAMRVTGAANPLTPVRQTLSGKLPQRKIVTGAADGYSSYGNQIGLATGIVSEIYHEGYAAKRMEIGAVIAAAPAGNVRRERPIPGDVVILLGGPTGRDGCGGATGSSKKHTLKSLETCGAEVQKGNAPEERKLQRLFRNAEASRLIKRCNDFGAGGVSVAIGELADGLTIDLNAVPKKYEGLDGTELAISESQERMAVVVAKEDEEKFLALAEKENLQACRVAVVKAEPRLTMFWNGKAVVDISREFLNSNGAEKHVSVHAAKPADFAKKVSGGFAENSVALAGDLNVCSGRGLSERFDSTIGAGTVLMPFGGKNQLTPIQAMVQKISVERGHTDDCSLMSWGYNPFISEKSPYHGAYLAVVESVAKLIATGAEFKDVYLTFQEYFERLGKEETRWGKPLSALLGALRAQLGLGVASIGGKDSMSGSFEKLDVPPTLVSFAVTTAKTKDIVSPEFKKAGDAVRLLTPSYGKDGLPEEKSLVSLFRRVSELAREGKIVSCFTPVYGGIAEGVMKSCFGNGLGFAYADGRSVDTVFGYSYGAFVAELAPGEEVGDGVLLGRVTDDGKITLGEESVTLGELSPVYENKLESVYRCNIPADDEPEETFSFHAETRVAPSVKIARPRVLIPVFPGTNCEYDSAKAVRDAGAEPEIFVVNNRSQKSVAESVKAFADEIARSQIVFIPGGFSGGDEPDGSGKFITAFFRNAAVRDRVTELLERRDGLMLGICNGFQALIKLGLVPFGKIVDVDETCPTLTFNKIGRHQSRIVRTRIASDKSPWLAETEVGEIYNVPISHGEGRFLADEALIRKLAANGQIATQYVDDLGSATDEIRFNPNGSAFAVEGITSPDGRVFGKMGHSERYASDLYRNVPGNYDTGLFRSAVKYFG
ncbi:MAG: phosphoribosylformylglycinamidine synthase [Candidatus Borkfalkiaceae bacterium]|nr:phosphoribosylformylglycinamidine synthase [Christensenellaceae bacterium]